VVTPNADDLEAIRSLLRRHGLSVALNHLEQADAAFARRVITLRDTGKVYIVAYIDGVERDLTTSRYADWDELAGYCRLVASTVGRMCVRIFGFDDEVALRRANQLLIPGGRIIVFVPASKELYGSLDQGIGHQRRYDKDELIDKLTRAGFEIEHASYQNRIAKLAWHINSTLLGRRALPAAQSRLFDYLVPMLRAFEGENPATGLSLIAVGKKTGGPDPALRALSHAVVEEAAK